MISVIIYATDDKFIDKTIDGVLDRTVDLGEIIVCDDAHLGFVRSGVKVISTDKLGRAKAWNAAAAIASCEHLVFIKDKTKVGDGWGEAISKALIANPNYLVSPIVHTLDLGLWATEPSRWRRFGWRWDLNLYDRTINSEQTDSAAISSYCIAVTKAWFAELGGFDDGMGVGAGEDIEISLKSWLLGGGVLVCDDAIVASAFEIDNSDCNNLCRIVETWLSEYASYFYAVRGLDPASLNSGRIKQRESKRSVEWFIRTKLPELLGVYDLRSAAAGKTIAVVAPGPSLDVVNQAWINRHDIIIGVDYIGLMFECNFVLTDSVHVVAELRKRYSDDKMILPLALRDQASGCFVGAGAIAPTSHQYERSTGMAASIDPPFCDFGGDLVLAAIHCALFLGPVSVTVFGYDNKFIGGNSHTSKVEYYNNGKLLDDTENVRRRFAANEYGLDQLGRLAHVAKIPLLRVGHA